MITLLSAPLHCHSTECCYYKSNDLKENDQLMQGIMFEFSLQVGMILYNFSFDDTNAGVLAGHPLCLR